MLNNDSAITITNLSKTFNIPHEKTSSVKSLLVNPFRGRGYEKLEVLKDISFEVKKGETLGLVGKNGSGKSTLLKIIAGIFRQDEGKIKIVGKLVPFLELGVGFNHELSARENIYLNGTILGMAKKQIDKAFNEIVEFSELEKFIDTPLKNFSSGMQVRLAFSIAIMTNADIYLLDEILSVGDAKFQKKCFKIFEQMKKQGKTMIFVSHSAKAVQDFCDRVIWIDEGNVRMIGEPKIVVDEYTWEMTGQRVATEAEEERKVDLVAEVKEVTVVNTSDKTIYTVQRGDDIYLKIKYKINQKLSLINIAVGIYEQDTRAIINVVNTRSEGIKAPFSKGEHIVTVKYPQVLLRKGKFTFSVVLSGATSAERYDYVFGHASFEAQPIQTEEGAVDLNHEWIIPNEK